MPGAIDTLYILYYGIIASHTRGSLKLEPVFCFKVFITLINKTIESEVLFGEEFYKEFTTFVKDNHSYDIPFSLSILNSDGEEIFLSKTLVEESIIMFKPLGYIDFEEYIELVYTKSSSDKEISIDTIT